MGEGPDMNIGVPPPDGRGRGVRAVRRRQSAAPSVITAGTRAVAGF